MALSGLRRGSRALLGASRGHSGWQKPSLSSDLPLPGDGSVRKVTLLPGDGARRPRARRAARGRGPDAPARRRPPGVGPDVCKAAQEVIAATGARAGRRSRAHWRRA